MIIAIDFDGTIVEHRYPDIGKEMLFAFETMKELQKQNHQLILCVHTRKRLLCTFAVSIPNNPPYRVLLRPNLLTYEQQKFRSFQCKILPIRNVYISHLNYQMWHRIRHVELESHCYISVYRYIPTIPRYRHQDSRWLCILLCLNQRLIYIL